MQLFDNAAKYSPPSLLITIVARARDGRMILSVSDQGAGLTVSEQPRSGTRFVRGERRAATTSGSGPRPAGSPTPLSPPRRQDEPPSAMALGQGTTLAIELPVAQAATPITGKATQMSEPSPIVSSSMTKCKSAVSCAPA